MSTGLWVPGGGSGGGATLWPKYITGRFYEPLNAFGAVASDFSLTVAADRFMLVPFYANRDFTIDQIGIELLSAVVSSNIKMAIYLVDPTTGLPGTLLYGSGNISTTSGTGYRYEACSVAMTSGTAYWIGGRYSAGIQVRASGTAQSVGVLGVSASSGTNKTMFGLQKSLAFATATPTNGTTHFAWTDSHNANAPDRPIFRVG